MNKGRGTMETFELAGSYIELNKLLKASGFCNTGGAAKIAIEEGLVKVDGQVEQRIRCKIRNGQKVEYKGNSIEVM